MSKYWEDETPVTVDTGKNVLQYYPESGKLVAFKSVGVSVDIRAIMDSSIEAMLEAYAVFNDIARKIEDCLGDFKS